MPRIKAALTETIDGRWRAAGAFEKEARWLSIPPLEPRVFDTKDEAYEYITSWARGQFEKRAIGMVDDYLQVNVAVQPLNG